MAVKTADDLLSLLAKSKLLSREQLLQARQLATEMPEADPADFARALAKQGLITRWQAGQLLAGRAAFYLGKYKLIQLLGRGGMGSVFLGQHVTMNRQVALKIVSREIGQDRDSLERFLAEARAIAALDHPNIVQAYSVDNERDRYYIVMEYVDGLDLQRMVETEGPLAFDRAADYIRQAADGLAHAHARNMIHCDIKPSNLLVNTQGVVKILDLGLARLTSRAGVAAARDDRMLGSVDYLAPEQAMGVENLDHRADIYSLGCTLYYLLTGHPPFPDGSLSERLVKHQTQEPRSIAQQRADTPDDLVRICEKMMAKQPDDRFQSAAEVSQALAQWRPAPESTIVVRKAAGNEEDLPPADFSSDSWWAALSGGPNGGEETPASGNGAKPQGHSAAAVKSPGKSSANAKTAVAKKPVSRSKEADRAAIPVAAAAGAVGKPSLLSLLDTPAKKIVVGLVAALVAMATLASPILLFMLLRSKPEPPTPKHVDRTAHKSEVAKDVAEEPEATRASTPKEAAQLAMAASTAESKAVVKEQPAKSAAKTPLASETKTTTTTAPKTDAKPPPPVAKTEPKTTPAAKPENKPPPPAPTKPAVKDPPKAKPKPFAALPAAAELPAVPKEDEAEAGAAPVPLGKVQLDADTALDVKLVGGDVICKGNPRFELKGKEDAPHGPWLIQAFKGKATDGVDVAELSLSPHQELAFRWLKGANNRASLLRNCGLDLAADGESRFLPLRPATKVKPLLEDSKTDVALQADGLPDVALLRLEITEKDLVGPFPPKPKFNVVSLVRTRHHVGAEAEAARPNCIGTKEHLGIVLAKDKAPPVMFNVAFAQRAGALTVGVKTGVQLGTEWIAISKVPFANGTATNQKAALDALRKSINPKDPRIKNLDQQIATLADVLNKIKALDSYAELNKSGRINFRVFVDLGPQQTVTLFQSVASVAKPADDAAAIPPAKGKKPAAGGKKPAANAKAKGGAKANATPAGSATPPAAGAAPKKSEEEQLDDIPTK